MVIFWILAALVSLSAFGYGMILMQWGLVGSLLFALAVLVFCRGLITWIRRSLILRERIADDDDTNKRTLETNRYIFWRRILRGHPKRISPPERADGRTSAS